MVKSGIVRLIVYIILNHSNIVDDSLNKVLYGRINFVENPIGLDIRDPFFSWLPNSKKVNCNQVAYRIIVSKDKSRVYNEVGDEWDSGKVMSKKTSFIYYEGLPLENFSKYYWRVKWWDNYDEVSVFSDVYSFETAFIEKNAWKGKWILVDSILRKEFNVNNDIKSAKIYISALGYYELRVNGKKIGTKVLTPQWTDYKKRILYSTYDVTENIKKNMNCIGVMVGNSRYTTEYGYDGKHQVIMDVLLTFKDGQIIYFGTNDSWETSSGPILYDDIYNGEVYDARLEQSGWDLPSFDDSKWKICTYSDSVLGELVSDALFPPIEIIGTMKPRSIVYNDPDRYILDFGQNYSGWIKIKLEGLKKGDEIKLRFAELLDENGINTGSNNTAKNEDRYISKGESHEIYEPRFTYHGFRYVEIKGKNLFLTLDMIEGKIVHSNVDPVGSIVFGGENEILNKIHKMVLWSQVSNLMGIPTDCPQRDERMGWLGDSSLVAEESIMNFDMYGFYKKWLDDIRDSQLEDGEIPDVVPPFLQLYPADPGWGDEYISILWDVYRYYGDKKILSDYYPYVKKWLDFLRGKTKDGILVFYKYGDWCPPKMIRPLDTPGELYATFILFKDLDIMAKIAKILGNNDQGVFERDKEIIKNAFNQRFLIVREQLSSPFLDKQRSGLPEKFQICYYGDREYGTQTSQILPLYFGITPTEKRGEIFDYLLKDIVIKCDNHLNTGIWGTRYLLQTLSLYGHSDIAFKVVTQTSYPGWGYMLKEGATTLWERWELLTNSSLKELNNIKPTEGGMNSHNHIMFGTVDNWFFDTLIGIEPCFENPGFDEFKISPHFVKEIRNLTFSFNSPKGFVYYNFKSLSEEKREVYIHVPTNTKCLIELDNREIEDVVSINSNLLVKRKDEEKIGYELNSGDYSIVIKMR